MSELVQHSLSAETWSFRSLSRETEWREAIVPGCVHLDLLRHDQIPDPFFGSNEREVQWIEEEDWSYRCEFDFPVALGDSDQIDLVADGLDTVAAIELNGYQVGHSENMFVGRRWSVQEALRPGRNELLIRFTSAWRHIQSTRREHRTREISDRRGRSQVMRKQPCQFGWDWGPRLVTAGIWRDIRLEGWRSNRLVDCQVIQTHRPDGKVDLRIVPRLLHEASGNFLWQVEISLGGKKVISVQDKVSPTQRLTIETPELWWPNGQGHQPLYEVSVLMRSANGRAVIDRWSRRIGLRTINLDRSRDQWGESFRFVVNGRPVFAKGANWIPAHAFVAGLKPKDYRRDLEAARAAHMNMVRVWGGGVYEAEAFYEACDELGLMVWQDFMFACALYPGDEAFLDDVRKEAKYQITRLRHHACLALWCGNNEVAQLNVDLLEDEKKQHSHDQLFRRVLPESVRQWDGVTDYWPSSQWRGNIPDSKGRNNAPGERSGDSHFWDVWHSRKPVKDYEKWQFRFCSEFGMQSYSSPETNRTFCSPEDGNVFGPTMENHQKNRAGNQIILDYVSRRYRYPKNQDALILLSQLNQAYCMQVGVEHFRRNSPRCMGALYWQLNDCWPVASWSSIEFGGRWKVAHYAARRFYAPALVSAHVAGDETSTIGNERESTIREVHLYTVFDGPDTCRGTLSWELRHFDGGVLESGRISLELEPKTSILRRSIELAKVFQDHGRDYVYLRIRLQTENYPLSENTVFFAPPRFLRLPALPITTRVHAKERRSWVVQLESAGYHHALELKLSGIDAKWTDNYFDLYPGEMREVRFEVTEDKSSTEIEAALGVRSLVHLSD